MSAVSSLNTKAKSAKEQYHYASASGGEATLSSKVYNIKIGSPEELATYEKLEAKLKTISERSINLLTIYAKNITINRDPGIVRLKPERLILVGATIEHKPFGSEPAGPRFDTLALQTGEWESVSAFLALSKESRAGVAVRCGSADTLIYTAKTVEAARELRPYFGGSYRMIIEVPFPS